MSLPGTIQFPALSANPSPPPTGSYAMYVKTDNTIYLEDSSGDIFAFGSTTGISQLTGDVSAIGPGSAVATVNFVGGQSAANVAAAAVAVSSATTLNTPSTLVERDASGNFSAGTITANLTGTATSAINATNAVNFTGSLSGDVTGTQSTTTIASTVVSGKLLTGYSVGSNTPILATDSILQAFEKIQAQINSTSGTAITALTGDGTATGPGSAVLTVHSVLGKAPGVANGLATLDGSTFVTASQIPFGSTVNTVTQGNDSRLSVQNIVKVKKNPGAGEFSSVVAALASITTASISNPFVISVGPGIYVETQIVMKNYVAIEGEQPFSTILVASNPAQAFILGADSSGLTRLGIQGATGSGGIGVYYSSNAAASPRFNILQCVFGNNNTLIQADGQNGNTVNLLLTQCAASGTNPFITGVLVTNDLVNTSVNLTISGLSIQALGATPPTDFIKASGINTNVILSSVILQSASGGNGVNVSNGTILTTNACSLTGFNQGLYVPNSGANCQLLVEGIQVNDSITADINILQSGAMGSVSGAFRTSNSTISSTNLSVFTTDPTDGITLTNTLTFGPNFADRTDITNLILKVPTMGLLSGGVLTSGGGFLVDVSAGTGYVTLGSYDGYITWGNSSITLTATSVNYIYFNSSSILVASPSFPNTASNILLGRVVTNSTGIEFIDASPLNTVHYGNLNDNFVREALGPIFSFGCLVTEDSTPLELDVTNGSYYFGDNNFLPSSGTAITFQTFYQNGSGGWIIGSSNTVDTNNYDNGSGTLQSIPTNDYVRHTLYLVGQGSNQQYLFVYAQTTYTTLVLAQTGTIPTPPSYFTDGVVLLASIIIKQGSSSIVSGGGQIVDNRPRIGFSPPAVQSVGTVTSVSLSLPVSVFNISGSPVTTFGTLTGNFNTQSANSVFAGPTSGSAAIPSFRSLVSGDIPAINLASSGNGGVTGILPNSNTTATNADTPSTLVERDSSGNFSAGTITANLTGTASGNLVPIFNEVQVQQTPGVGQFSSIAAAIASITTASSTNPFLVTIGPGIYVEPQIQMKPYVYVSGAGFDSTVITPSNPAVHLILGADFSALLRCELTGVTGPGQALIYHSSLTGTSETCFYVEEVRFGASDTLVLSVGNNTASLSTVSTNSCRFGSIYSFNTGFHATTTGSNPGKIEIRDLLASGMQTPYPADVILADAINCEIVINGMQCRSGGTTSGNCIRARNGAILRILSLDMKGFGTGLFLENVGTGCTIAMNATNFESNTVDLSIQNTSTRGLINVGAALTNSSIVSGISNLALAILDTVTGDINTSNMVNIQQLDGTFTDATTIGLVSSPMGVMNGGTISVVSGLTVNVASGYGYLDTVGSSLTTGSIHRLNWSSTNITLSANSNNYLFWNSSAVLSTSSTLPDTAGNILLGRVVTNSTGIEFIDSSPLVTHHYGNLNDDFVRQALGSVFAFGCQVSENVTPLHLNLSAGSYWFGNNNFLPSAETGFTFQTFYQNGSGGWVIGSTNTVDTSNYDNGSGTLQPIPSNQYARHALYLVGQGANQQELFVYAQTTYTTLVLAQTGNIPIPPSYFTDGVVLVASIIVKQGSTSIIAGGGQIVDNRPRIGFSLPAVEAVGTVTSVALSLPSIFSVSGSPVTSSGTLTGSLNTQNANMVFAGPTSGSAAIPSFRSLVNADIPSLGGDITGTIGATTVSKIQGTVVSGTTGTTNVVFSNGPTLVAPIAITGSSTTALTLNSTSFVFDTTNDVLGIGLQPSTAVMIDGINTTGASKLIQMTGYGVGSTTGYRGRFARGTVGTPAAVQSGDILNALSGRGYGASQFAAASTGVINVVAGETFTNTSNLTYLQFSTTPTGSVTSAEAMRVASTGVTLGPQSASTAIHQINGGVNNTTKTITASTYTIDTTTTDNIIYTDSTSNAITVTLPTATNGRVLMIQDKTGQASTNHITITPPGLVTINGVNASVLLGVNYGGWVFTSDGTNWTSYRLAQLPSVQAISASNIDWATVGVAGGLFTKTLSANTTFTFSNATAGQTIVIRITNTASNYTVTWGTTVKWPVQTAPVQTVGAFSDVYTIVFDGTSYYGSYVQNF